MKLAAQCQHFNNMYTTRVDRSCCKLHLAAPVQLQGYSTTPIIILECEIYSLFMIKRKLLFVLSINNLQYAYYYYNTQYRDFGTFLWITATVGDWRLYQFKSALTKPFEFQCIEYLHVMLYRT